MKHLLLFGLAVFAIPAFAADADPVPAIGLGLPAIAALVLVGLIKKLL